MTLNALRSQFLAFFKEKGHAIIPSASLIPENDPTVLFTTAGMHPLVPYLLGEKHPLGARLANSQKCLRTDDIEEVGDNRHLTFFEMLGNWSLGDYFKQEAIEWSLEFLTDEKWLHLDPKKIFISIFEGDVDAPRDEESFDIWQSLFLTRFGMESGLGDEGMDEPTQGKNGPRIYAYGKKKNWWGPAGLTGPCGPDTEIFYDTGRVHDQSFGKVCHPNCDCGRFVEIWNNVFMQYEKRADGIFLPLKQKNVDTGMGLERMVAIMQGVETVFETDAFIGLIEKIKQLSGKNYTQTTSESDVRSFRIIADHVRAATFIIGDLRGVAPSNIGQGYIVRRLLRRAIREGRRLGITNAFIANLASVIISEFSSAYPELDERKNIILEEMKKEEEKFGKTLEKGMKELDKILRGGGVTGEKAFLLFSSYGFPLELTEEIVRENGITIDRATFETEFKKHQELSRSASAGVFKGGLADHSEETTRLHTATHLLHQALRQVLGDHVEQKGSNITVERLRFDFSHPTKITIEELARVETIVNKIIEKDLPVCREELTVEEAKARGAIGLFEHKYSDKVSMYTIGNEQGVFSKEICGGPHVLNTGELGAFKILKEEAVSAGIRRIKAVVGEVAKRQE